MTSRVGEPTAERGGRRKKFYTLEPEGLRVLDRSWAEVRDMSSGLTSKLASRVAMVEEVD